MAKKIPPGQAIEVKVSARDVLLIREHTFADPEYANRLKEENLGSGTFRGKYTLDDLDDLLGYIAAEVNHTKNKKLRKELDSLFDRLQKEVRSYDDGGWS